ncbi:GAF domain-containing protein [Catellatospora tritici]|uniref:GAF domain-containing protein n=1 Tax=Catellatospora tritici TaxID=2851566 RepID=UPI001C2DE47B|nr:GAF domain-containing protein [Catellatospora tritici]MBV1850646.1 GAF domain-containing protein [Catellatospora tritici]
MAPGGLAVDNLSRELLQSVVDVARAIFGAQASSVFLLDVEAYELVFHAVSGQGQRTLLGQRFPAGSGIAGWVVATGEPMLVDDLTHSAAFDRALAESTGYVPQSLLAAPLIQGDRVFGVLEVLDPSPRSRSNLEAVDLLALFARQAAAALRIVIERHQLDGVRTPGGLDPDDRASARQLMYSLQRLLDTSV